MELKPTQRPHPPLWYASSPVNAGRYGADVLNFSSIASLPTTEAIYKEHLHQRASENDPKQPQIDEPLYGSRKRIYLADTDAEAMERARSAYAVYRANFRSPYPEVIGAGRSRARHRAPPLGHRLRPGHR